MSQHHHQPAELAKVGLIGFGGWFATVSLTDVATVVSILVGIATLTYVILKTVLLYKNRNKLPPSGYDD